eukprot:scaffold89351_cov31-Tisochrysis_lutea.AAC.3
MRVEAESTRDACGCTAYLGVILGGQVRDVLDERKLELGIDRGNEAPIKDAQPAIRCTQEVARMRVAVEDAVGEHHLQVGRHGERAQPRDVMLRRGAVEPLALDPLRRQHWPAAQLWQGTRREHRAVERASAHALVEALGIARLGRVIELIHESLAPRVGSALKITWEAEKRCERCKHVADEQHVKSNLPNHPWTLHFDSNGPPVGGLPLVHLAERRGGDR